MHVFAPLELFLVSSYSWLSRYLTASVRAFEKFSISHRHLSVVLLWPAALQHECGGALIQDTQLGKHKIYVLTAAHCVIGKMGE